MLPLSNDWIHERVYQTDENQNDEKMSHGVKLLRKFRDDYRLDGLMVEEFLILTNIPSSSTLQLRRMNSTMRGERRKEVRRGKVAVSWPNPKENQNPCSRRVTGVSWRSEISEESIMCIVVDRLKEKLFGRPIRSNILAVFVE